MGNVPTPSRRTSGPDNDAVPARLVAIEQRLAEIIRRLDEMKSLLTTLSYAQSDRQCSAED
jgi:hypothetical protein